MEENKNENKINTEEIKSETVNTVNEVKETIKKVDVKKDTLETKGFIKELFTDPLGKMKAIAEDNSNKFLKNALIVVIIWMAAVLIKQIFGTTSLWKYYGFKQFINIILTTISPAVGIIVMSVIIMIVNKENKKSLTQLITCITTARLPLAIAGVVSLLTLINSSISAFTTPFSKLCSVISILLTYFVAKDIFAEKENSKFIKKFVIIEGIYYIAYFVLTYLGIYI
ncbi:MAG: hypothetical protein IJE05_05640 [Clostridia bacterium]|nr:hypothetical protein [Clostridia bacterium]